MKAETGRSWVQIPPGPPTFGSETTLEKGGASIDISPWTRLKPWYDNLARGSKITAEVYLPKLGGFCGENQATPRALASTVPRKLEELLMDYLTANEKRYAGSYPQSTVKAVSHGSTTAGPNRLISQWVEENEGEVRLDINIPHSQVVIEHADRVQCCRRQGGSRG